MRILHDKSNRSWTQAMRIDGLRAMYSTLVHKKCSTELLALIMYFEIFHNFLDEQPQNSQQINRDVLTQTRIEETHPSFQCGLFDHLPLNFVTSRELR